MSIPVGTLLGSHQIMGLLGRGGMGEVYRARDTKLKREVAIKILPEEFSHDPDRLSRFQREAEILALLNHPNIAAIYDVAEAGACRFLVLELVEGETLADRIARGPIPIQEALDIVKHICEALEAAHEKGIVHRDLKPANIKITPDGKVKVLDFGLAKLQQNPGGEIDPSAMPTVLDGSMLGAILGTAAYMSPEQTRGKTIDARTDIWAFGCILYEMLTARHAFDGESLTDIMTEVVTCQPNWNLLPIDTPSSIRVLLAGTLSKEPKQRLQNIHDAQLFVNEGLISESLMVPIPRDRRGRHWLATVSLSIALAAALISASLYFRRESRDVPAIRFEMPAPEISGRLTISPDGRRIAYVGSMGDKSAIWIHPIGAVNAQRLTGTENASSAFWSPDSRYLGFMADGKLKKIDVSGGPAQVLCDALVPNAAGTWNRDGVILFSGAGGVIVRVAASGGPATPVTTIDPSRKEWLHGVPQFLPDGRHFLYHAFRTGSNSEAAVFVGSLDSKSATLLGQLEPGDSRMIYTMPGYLLLTRNGTLIARRFDANRLALAGNPLPIAENVQAFAASENGVLVYRTATSQAAAHAISRQLLWFDRKGNPEGEAVSPSTYGNARLSPDGHRVAVDTNASGNPDIWIIDLAQAGASARLTFDPAPDTFPVWSPDGSRIAFASGRPEEVTSKLYQRSASGTGTDELLFAGSADEVTIPQDWSLDGRYIIFLRAKISLFAPSVDLWCLPLFGEKKAFPLVRSSSRKVQPQLSPDGRWLAYTTNESGTYQVVVQPFPDPGKGKWQVTAKGGIEPRWRRDGRELFYMGLDGKLMAVPIKAADVFEAGPPGSLFQTVLSVQLVPSGFRYDVTTDGQHILINSLLTSSNQASSDPIPITAVVNWTAALKKK